MATAIYTTVFSTLSTKQIGLETVAVGIEVGYTINSLTEIQLTSVDWVGDIDDEFRIERDLFIGYIKTFNGWVLSWTTPNRLSPQILLFQTETLEQAIKELLQVLFEVKDGFVGMWYLYIEELNFHKQV